MFGLTYIGVFHTLISLVAVLAGLVALARYQEILPTSLAGRVYVAATVIVCLSGFFIFQHGGFGKPHALAAITLGVLVVAGAARLTRIFGRTAPCVETVSYSLTAFFHTIPGITETVTRLPRSEPLVADPDSPVLQAIFGLLFLVFLIGAFLQVRRLRALHGATADLRLTPPGREPRAIMRRR